MTRETIDNNRALIIEALRATKKEEAEGIISRMTRSNFFTASCTGHDESEGGKANQALWRLYFARQIWAEMLRKDPQLGLEEEDVVIAALDHSSSSRTDAIVNEAERKSIEYCDSIPYGSEAAEVFKAQREDCYVDIVFDQDDHRMWLGSNDYEGIFDGSETLSEFPVHHVASVPVRPDGNGRDILVMHDDDSMYAMMFLSEDGDEEAADLYRSDKVMFGYSELVFFITRYPQYRSSYIAARNAKGFWGVYRVRENRKKRADHKIIVEKVVDFTWRSCTKAVGHMSGHTGYPISVLHPDFYTRISF